MWYKLLKLHHFDDNLYDVCTSLMGFVMGDKLVLKMITSYCFAQKLVDNIKSCNNIRKATNALQKHNKFVCKAILKFKGF